MSLTKWCRHMRENELVAMFEENIRAFGLPVSIRRILQLTQRQYPSIKRIEVKRALEASNKFVLVDAYNEAGSIYALAEWPMEKRSMRSYEDWETHTPRLGIVVVMMYEILTREGAMTLNKLRDYLVGVRHHESILNKIVEIDPLFRFINSGEVDLVSEDKYEYEYLVSKFPLIPENLLEDRIYNAQCIVLGVSEEFVIGQFIRRFPRSFCDEELILWVTLFGLNRETFLTKLFEEKPCWALGKVYVFNQIESISALKDILSEYKLEIDSVLSIITSALKQAEGFLEAVLTSFPLKRTVCEELLCIAGYVQVVPGHWFSKGSLPEAVLSLANFREKLRMDLKLLIIQTFQNEKHVMTIKELIFEALGIVNPSPDLKSIFSFMLAILGDSVSRISDTGYWGLTDWQEYLNKELITTVLEWVEEMEFAKFQDIYSQITSRGYIVEYQSLEKTLLYWPDFIKIPGGLYFARTRVDEESQALVKEYVRKILKEYPEGLKLSLMLNELENRLMPHSNNFKWETLILRRFLKTLGEVAIVDRRYIYPMNKAPYQRMRLGDVAYRIINEAGEPVSYAELLSEIETRTNFQGSISTVLLAEPKLSRPSRGYYALREWGLYEYNPEIYKEIQEILVKIISSEGRPLHKREIRSHLNRRQITMSYMTLHMNLLEEPRITQIARGVYSLTKWDLEFRQLLRYNFPFQLKLPDSNTSVIEVEEGTLFEYLVTKVCLAEGRLLIRRQMSAYFQELEVNLKFKIIDNDGQTYMGWSDKIDSSRWQIRGLKRWYKSFRTLYGDVIYALQSNKDPQKLTLYTSEQANEIFDI